MSGIPSLSISQTAGATNSQQAVLQQAKRAANQAESTAQTLATQASSAQTTATSAQNYARSLTTQASQAQLNVGWTQQNLTAVETASQLGTQISSVIKNVVNAEPVNADATTIHSSPTSTQPVVNTQGQVTGTIINTSA